MFSSRPAAFLVHFIAILLIGAITTGCKGGIPSTVMESCAGQNRCFAGLDLQFDESTSAWKVLQVWDGSPAAQAGILAGDTIVSINGSQLLAWSHAFSTALAESVETRPWCSTEFHKRTTAPLLANPMAAFGRSAKAIYVVGRKGDQLVKTVHLEPLSQFLQHVRGHNPEPQISSSRGYTQCVCLGCYECEPEEDGIKMCLCSCWACWPVGLHPAGPVLTV